MLIPDLITPDSVAEKKPTLGSKIYELLQHGNVSEQGVIETREAMAPKYLAALEETIKKHEHVKGTYHILVVLFKEPKLPGVMRAKFIARLSAPEQQPGCTLFSFNNDTGDLKHHWTVPAYDGAHFMDTNPDMEWDQDLVKGKEDFKKRLII